jgi:hypothetical protein
MIWFNKKKKANTYLITHVRPPVEYHDMAHIYYDYWDSDGVRHRDHSVCVSKRNECTVEEVHQRIQAEIRKEEEIPYYAELRDQLEGKRFPIE